MLRPPAVAVDGHQDEVLVGAVQVLVLLQSALDVEEPTFTECELLVVEFDVGSK